MKQTLQVSLALFLLSACSELEPFMPDVQFDTLTVREITFEEAKVDFVFTVENPNPLDVKLASFSYALGFEEIELISGENEDGLELKAMDSSTIELPVDLVFSDAWNTVQATRGQDEIDFGLEGHFGFNIPQLGEVEVPYDAGGSFPALRTPTFSLQALRAKNIDLFTQTATLELDVGIDNEHASALQFTALDYDLTLGGASAARGLIADLAEVEGAFTKTVTLPIEIDLLNVGSSVVTALTGGGRLDVGFDATVDVLTPFQEQSIPLSIDETGNLTVGD